MAVTKEHTFTLPLDAQKIRGLSEQIEFITGDRNRCILNITITQGEQPVDITGNSVQINIKKPDGQVVIQDSVNNPTKVQIIDATNGLIKITLEDQSISAAGVNIADIVLIDGESRSTTQEFSYFVRASKDSQGALQSTSVISYLQQLIAAYEAATNENTVVELTDGRHDNITGQDFNDVGDRMDSLRSQLSDIADDDSFLNNHFLSHLSSYLGLINTGYVADDGTRFYILPKDYVTTGVGGAIKIFGDPYHLDQTKYRDLGVYFYADQNGDAGYNGKGCFFINCKVAGTDYADKHPDIVFSFQDGAQIAGRFVRLNNANGTYTCQIIGSGTVEMANLDGTIRAELHGKMGVRNNQFIVWLNAAGTSLDGIIGYTSGDIMQVKGKNGNEFYVNSVKKFEITLNTSKFYNAVVHNPKYVLSDSGVTTPDVTGYNRIQFGQSSPVTITNFLNGQDGQQLRILFSNGNTTLQHGTNIRLAGGVNFVGSQYATLTLELFGTTWYEMSRSINHA